MTFGLNILNVAHHFDGVYFAGQGAVGLLNGDEARGEIAVGGGGLLVLLHSTRCLSGLGLSRFANWLVVEDYQVWEDIGHYDYETLRLDARYNWVAKNVQISQLGVLRKVHQLGHVINVIKRQIQRLQLEQIAQSRISKRLDGVSAKLKFLEVDQLPEAAVALFIEVDLILRQIQRGESLEALLQTLHLGQEVVREVKTLNLRILLQDLLHDVGRDGVNLVLILLFDLSDGVVGVILIAALGDAH